MLSFRNEKKNMLSILLNWSTKQREESKQFVYGVHELWLCSVLLQNFWYATGSKSLAFCLSIFIIVFCLILFSLCIKQYLRLHAVLSGCLADHLSMKLQIKHLSYLMPACAYNIFSTVISVLLYIVVYDGTFFRTFLLL